MSYAKNISGKILSIIHYPLSILLMAACGGPRIIPDKELALIFHDIFLVNGYVSQEGLNIDSLNIYEPVFAAYGYTSEDVQSTIGNFAKRKSARLADDVVEVAVEMLRRESRHYHRRVEIRDTIALIAKKRFAETVYSDSLIRVRRTGDTGLLRIVVPDVRRGSYEVSFNYLFDSLDRNPLPRTNIYLADAKGRRSGVSTRRLVQDRHSNITATLNAGDNHRDIVLALNGYPENLTTPNLTIDSLRVTYYLPEDIAVARLARTWIPGRLDSLINPSYETRIVTPLVDTLGP
jgi:hypothetical protein